jgi:Protein of unknown function (DUF3305)
MTDRQAVQVAVVMQRTAAPNQWEDWQFRVTEVVPDEGVFGSVPRKLHDDGRTSHWLYPGFTVALFPDECKGYFLNLTSGRPAWFVSWEVAADEPSMAAVTAVSVSYIEADRRLTTDERVETVPLEPELCEWLQSFTNAHFRPDGPRKVRAMSFLSPEERARHAAAPTPADDNPEAGRGGSAGKPATAVAAPTASEAPLAPPEAHARTRNEALRHLFLTDPHFRSTDGLDVGIDEVLEIASSPRARQRKIMIARAMGMLDDDLLDQDSPPSGESPA